MPTAGGLLKRWRAERGLSQLELALQAGLSARHLCFVETGRSSASAATLHRLADALALDPARRSALLAAAAPAPSAADRLVAALQTIDAASTIAELVDEARPALAEWGMNQFFFGTVRSGRRHRFDAVDHGAFAPGWLERYAAEGYAETDPLVSAAADGPGCFFWEEVVDRPRLPAPARRMFDEAAAHGVDDGFIASVACPNGDIRLVSMMGRQRDRPDPARRLALRLLGRQMVDGLARIEAAYLGR